MNPTGSEMVEDRRCTARVPDHTDFNNCGDVVLRSNRCAQHLQEEVKDLYREIRKHEDLIARCRTRLGELTTEAG